MCWSVVATTVGAAEAEAEVLAEPGAAWAQAAAWVLAAVMEQVWGWAVDLQQAALGLIRHCRHRRMRQGRAD